MFSESDSLIDCEVEDCNNFCSPGDFWLVRPGSCNRYSVCRDCYNNVMRHAIKRSPVWLNPSWVRERIEAGLANSEPKGGGFATRETIIQSIVDAICNE
jgi:hypothetical protein